MKPAVVVLCLGVLCLVFAACGKDEPSANLPTKDAAPSLTSEDRENVAKEVAGLVMASLLAERENSPKWRPLSETLTLPVEYETECEVSGHIKLDGIAEVDFQRSGTHTTTRAQFDIAMYYESCATFSGGDTLLVLDGNPELRQTGFSETVMSSSSGKYTDSTISSRLDLLVAGPLSAQKGDGETFDCDVSLKCTADGVGQGIFTISGVIEGEVCGEKVLEVFSSP